jgi:hypothetical protein
VKMPTILTSGTKKQLWCKYLNSSDEQVRNGHLI